MRRPLRGQFQGVRLKQLAQLVAISDLFERNLIDEVTLVGNRCQKALLLKTATRLSDRDPARTVQIGEFLLGKRRPRLVFEHGDIAFQRPVHLLGYRQAFARWKG